MWWLKTAENDFLTVLEAGGLKSRPAEPHSVKAPGENLFRACHLTSGVARSYLLSLVCRQQHSDLCLHHHMVVSQCISVLPTLFPYDIICTSCICTNPNLQNIVMV